MEILHERSMGYAHSRSVINDDQVWFEILKEFMIENAKGFANTNDLKSI